MLIGLIVFSEAWTRCGPAKACKCFVSAGVVSCQEAGLRQMPQVTYDRSKGYRTVDLRGTGPLIIGHI